MSSVQVRSMLPGEAVDGPQRGDEQRRERAEVRHPQPQHRGPQEEPQPQPGVTVEDPRSDRYPLISVQACVQSWYVVHCDVGAPVEALLDRRGPVPDLLGVRLVTGVVALAEPLAGQVAGLAVGRRLAEPLGDRGVGLGADDVVEPQVRRSSGSRSWS